MAPERQREREADQQRQQPQHGRHRECVVVLFIRRRVRGCRPAAALPPGHGGTHLARTQQCQQKAQGDQPERQRGVAGRNVHEGTRTVARNLWRLESSMRNGPVSRVSTSTDLLPVNDAARQ